VIHLDGKPHLPANVTLWNADSRGHWEGNTLLVDVTNNNAKARLGRSGEFTSDRVHIAERYIFGQSGFLLEAQSHAESVVIGERLIPRLILQETDALDEHLASARGGEHVVEPTTPSSRAEMCARASSETRAGRQVRPPALGDPRFELRRIGVEITAHQHDVAGKCLDRRRQLAPLIAPDVDVRPPVLRLQVGVDDSNSHIAWAVQRERLEPFSGEAIALPDSPARAVLPIPPKPRGTTRAPLTATNEAREAAIAPVHCLARDGDISVFTQRAA
jgi:hypothetical protein